MNGAYLADKDIAKLAHLWKQKAANGYWLNIYIWANQESMRAAGIFENSGHMACFIGVPASPRKRRFRRVPRVVRSGLLL